VFQAGVFSAWDGVCYRPVDREVLRGRLYAVLELAQRPDGMPFKPNTRRVSDVLDALRGGTVLDESLAPPRWLGGPLACLWSPAEVLCCANGLLHLPTLKLEPATPDFYSFNAVDFPYNAEAPEPAAWRAFLQSLWPDDPEAIALLQEWCGYMLTADTSQEKILLIIGPKRSGKGTIARVLTGLLGQANVAGPTLSSLSTNFGLQPLISKLAAIIADARLGSRTDQAVVAERLLSISGEDALTIDRKHLPAWTGRLGIRFILLTNELPRITGVSGALASRFMVLTLRQSFYGFEDHGLTGRLLQELPGILNWAIEGRQRLRNRGFFVTPKSSLDAVRQLEDLSSPIGAFLREDCDIGTRYTVSTKRLFESWQSWCKASNKESVGTEQMFGKDLAAAVPGITITNPRHTAEGRQRFYLGVRLKTGF
jgi:putative DNA primase/helicase